MDIYISEALARFLPPACQLQTDRSDSEIRSQLPEQNSVQGEFGEEKNS